MQFLKFTLAALSFSSAIAAPVKETRDTTVVGSIQNAINSAKPVIESELASLNNDIIGGVINQGAVPAVNTVLVNVQNELNGLIQNVTALANGIVIPLANGELSNIPTAVGSIVSLVSEIESALSKIVLSSSPAVLNALGSEINTVSNLIAPLLNPIIGVINTAIGSASAPVALILKALLATLQGLVGGITAPVTTAAGQIS